MWRKTHGLTSRNFWNLATWSSILGFISTVVALICIGKWGWERYVSLGACIVFFSVFVASLFKSAYEVWQKDTPKLDLIEEQRRDVSQFLHPNISRLFVHASKEIGVDIDWSNNTVFRVEFISASGTATMDGVALGQIVPFVQIQNCDPSRHCTCTLYVKVGQEQIDQVNLLRSQRKAVDWQMNITWNIAVSEIGYKGRLQGPPGGLVVPGGNQ